MTIATGMTTLDAQRDNLAANLVTKGVTASNTETLTQLVPKVLDITTGTPTMPAGKLVTDGLLVRIDPNSDSYTLDGSDNIVTYAVTTKPDKPPMPVGPTNLNIGINADWDSDDGYFRVSDNAAYFTTNTSGRQLRVSVRDDYQDVDITVNLKFASVASFLSYIVMTVPNKEVDFYGYTVGLNGGLLKILVYNGTSPTTTLMTKAVTPLAGTTYTLRAQRVGTALKLKFWVASETEPVAWDLEATSTGAYATGKVGLYSFYSSARIDYDTFVTEALGTPIQEDPNVVDITGAATVISTPGFLNGMKRIRNNSATVMFQALWTNFFIPGTVIYTVFLLVRRNAVKGTRPNNITFTNGSGSPLSVGLLGDQPGKVNGLLTSNEIGGIQNVKTLEYERADCVCLVSGRTVLDVSDFKPFAFGIALSGDTSSAQWATATTDQAEVRISANEELIEFIYYGRSLSDAEMDDVHNYLATKYDSQLSMQLDESAYGLTKI